MNRSEQIVPRDNDVLFGRGNRNSRHYGNELLRALARRHIINYRNASKKEKAGVSQSIVSQIKDNQNPPGRFLKKDFITGFWQEVTDEMAKEKTSQALRDAVSSGKVKIQKLRPRTNNTRKEYNTNVRFQEQSLPPVKQYPMQDSRLQVDNHSTTSSQCKTNYGYVSVTMPPVCFSPIKARPFPRTFDTNVVAIDQKEKPSLYSNTKDVEICNFFDFNDEDYDKDSMNDFGALLDDSLFSENINQSSSRQKRVHSCTQDDNRYNASIQSSHTHISNSIIGANDYSNNNPYYYSSTWQEDVWDNFA